MRAVGLVLVEDQIRYAQQLFESGDTVYAAEMLRQLRERSAERGDTTALALINDLTGQMRAVLNTEEREHFEGALKAVPANPPPTRHNAADPAPLVDTSPWGLGLALGGAVTMLISAFLPYAESSTFARIASNTMIQNGNGWIFIGIALLGGGAVYRAHSARTRTRTPTILGAIGIAAAIFDGTHTGTLCPVGPAANLNIPCVSATPGVGVYVAGVGALLMLLGGWQFFATRTPITSKTRPPSNPSGLKTCPDCAEEVRAAARICKHCGYRFDPPDMAIPTA